MCIALYGQVRGADKSITTKLILSMKSLKSFPRIALD